MYYLQPEKPEPWYTSFAFLPILLGKTSDGEKDGEKLYVWFEFYEIRWFDEHRQCEKRPKGDIPSGFVNFAGPAPFG